MDKELVPDEDFLCAASWFLGVDGAPRLHDFFLVASKRLGDEGHVSIAQQELR